MSSSSFNNGVGEAMMRERERERNERRETEHEGEYVGVWRENVARASPMLAARVKGFVKETRVGV